MKIAPYFQQDKFVLAGSGQYSSVRFAIPCITISIFGYILARHRSVNDWLYYNSIFRICKG